MAEQPKSPKIPSAAAYKRAFHALTPQITPSQLSLLRAHYRHARHQLTSSELSEIMGWGGEAANLHYGELGRLMGKRLSFKHRSHKVWTLAEFAWSDRKRKYEWVMRPQVVQALEQLGWVGRSWRMSMRFGNQGPSLWPQCFRKGVAAIAYRDALGIDLGKLKNREKVWQKLQPTRRGFMQCFVEKMQPGDTIYVKDGPQIVGKGTIVGPYYFDRDSKIRIPEEPDFPFQHLRRIRWEDRFEPVVIDLQASQSTVLELRGERLLKLETLIVKRMRMEAKTSRQSNIDRVYSEGGVKEVVTEIGDRSAALRNDAIQLYGTICEVCDFDFGKTYGDLGKGFIEVHHLRPISSSKRHVIQTALEDVVVVCANCHRMLHRHGANPLAIESLRKIVSRNR